jgi:hypothetical protein
VAAARLSTLVVAAFAAFTALAAFAAFTAFARLNQTGIFAFATFTLATTAC